MGETIERSPAEEKADKMLAAVQELGPAVTNEEVMLAAEVISRVAGQAIKANRRFLRQTGTKKKVPDQSG